MFLSIVLIHLTKGFFLPETGNVLDRLYILLLRFSVTLSCFHECTEFRSDLSCEKYYPSSTMSNYFAGMKLGRGRNTGTEGPSVQAFSGIVARGSSSPMFISMDIWHTIVNVSAH